MECWNYETLESWKCGTPSSGLLQPLTLSTLAGNRKPWTTLNLGTLWSYRVDALLWITICFYNHFVQINWSNSILFCVCFAWLRSFGRWWIKPRPLNVWNLDAWNPEPWNPGRSLYRLQLPNLHRLHPRDLYLLHCHHGSGSGSCLMVIFHVIIATVIIAIVMIAIVVVINIIIIYK